MAWGKLSGFLGLKAIVLACFLTPVSVPFVPITPAYAQFQIVIPGFGYRGYRRGYRSRGATRSSRRGGNRGGEQQQPSSSSSAGGGGTPVTSRGGYKSSSD